MTRFASALSLVALVFAAPLAAQAARDFQLPPAPTPSADTRVQGPVDPDAPVLSRPRAIETPRPAAPTPTPTATASAAPVIVLPPATTATAPAARTTAPRALPNQASPTIAPTLTPPSVTPTITAGTPQPLPSATATPLPPSPEAPTLPLPWLWIALGTAALVTVGGLILWLRRRAAPVTPAIIAPHVPVAEPGEGLAIAVEAMRMDRSVLNATVGYRVTVRNRTARALNGVTVEADLVSAGANRPAEQQLATPALALTPRHKVERLAPGQSLRFEGQVRLPLAEASAIWQGRVGLLVPLLRMRATATDAAPVATTLVIGRAEGSTARPQPFRLDEPPRSYAPLAQRVLDAVPARV